MSWQWIINAQDVLLAGLKMTGLVTAVAIFFGLTLGALIALCRTSEYKALRLFGMIYINGFRMQALLVVLSAFYLIAMTTLRKHGIYTNIDLPAALIAFSLFEAAYFAEILRTGINGVDPGQRSACQALGFSKWQTYKIVVLPQAIKNALPSIVIQCITIFQDSTLIYVVGVSDFFGATLHVGERDSNTEGAIIFVALVYLVLSLLLRRLTRRFTGGQRL